MSVLSSFRIATPPAVAVEFASTRLSAARVEFRSGKATIAAHATEPLPDGALVPSLMVPNIHDRPAVIGALGRLFDRLGGRPRRIGLVVPDPVAKVSLVRFEQVPPHLQDLDQLVRWQVRKTAPFSVDDAQLSYLRGARSGEGQDFVVSIARRDIVEGYESVCAEVGAHAGIVDLATFNVINAVIVGSEAPAGDWLLVNVAADYASIAILRGEDLIFFRNRTSETDGTLADLVHQAGMYYEDRLGGTGFERVLLTGAAGTGSRQTAEVERIRRGLEERLGRRVETVDPRNAAALTDRISVAPALLDTLTPLVGLLLRGREAA
ncbi:MAG: pilus assembly protein PilM [Acidobacteriota bacterium]